MSFLGDIVGGKKTWRTTLAGVGLQLAMNRMTSSGINMPGRDPNVVYKNINNMPAMKRRMSKQGGRPNKKVMLARNKSLTRWPKSKAKVFKPSGFGKSSGKLYTKDRKFRRNKKNRYQRRGHVLTHENNRTISTTDQVVYVGHHTHPLEQVRFEMWAGILKRFFAEFKQYPFDRAQQLSEFGFAVGDIVRVTYETTPTASITTYDYTVAGGQTFNNLIADLGSASRPWFAANVSGESFQLKLNSIMSLPIAASNLVRTYLDLSQTYISMYSVSHQKIQNRTVNQVGVDSSEEVDNMPLYGKGYLCSRNQLQPATPSVGVINEPTTDQRDGVLSETSSSTTGALPREPPQGSYWRGVSAVGKIHLDPGVIKTSTVKATLSGNVNTILAKLSQISTISQRILPFGKMKFYALEKMINSDATRPIVVSLETNTTLYVTVNVKRSTQMRPAFNSTTGV